MSHKISTGVVAYARKQPSRLAASAIALASVAALPAAAQADEAFDSAPNEVSGVIVTGRNAPLTNETDLSVMPTTIQDAPQAINVIDNVQLRTRGVNTLEQALRTVPGITVTIGEGGQLNGDQFRIRGFDAKDDVYIDGLRDFGVYTRDSFNYEEVQVLKGPSGALFGRGTTGGVINTLSKRPRLEDSTSLDGYVGTGDYYRALADINHQVGDTSAVRLNLMASSTGVKDRDLIKSERWGAALTFGYGLDTNTSVIGSYLHQHDRRRPDYGIIIVQRPGDIVARPATEYDVGVDRSNFLGFRNDRDTTDADVVTVRVTHVAAPWLTITSDTRVGVYSRYFQYSTLDQCNAACTTALFDNNPATEAFGGIGGGSPYDQDSWGAQNITVARIDGPLGNLKNQLIVGTDVSYQSNKRRFLAYTLPIGIITRPGIPHPIVNPDPNFPAGYTVFRPVPGGNLFCAASGNCTTNVLGATVVSNLAATASLKTTGESSDLGAFITDRLWLADQWSLLGSLRLDRYHAEQTNLLVTGLESPAGGVKVNQTLKSPRVSLLYEPAEDATFYASWSRSETPQGTSIVGAGGAVSVTAKDLDPEISTSWELGAKVAVLQDRVAATASLFRVKKGNALQADPGTGFLVAQSGEKQRINGVELGLTGRVNPAWTITAGYTYLDSKTLESFSSCVAAPANTSGTPTAIVCPVGTPVGTQVLNNVATGAQVIFVPKHAFALYTNYDLGEWVDGLSVGGDVAYQSKLPVRYTARSTSYADRSTLTPTVLAEVPGGATLNLYASYRFANYRVGLNIYNVTDELNYGQSFGNRAVPIQGRTFILSLGTTF